MIEHRALGVRPAGCCLARVDAFVRDARLVRVAVLVRPAAERAHVVQTDMAQEAVVVESAGEQAVAADALLVERALVVGDADWEANVVAAGVAIAAVARVSAGHWQSNALHFRVPGEAGRTATLLNVTPHVAFRVYSARGPHVARVQALSIQAHVRQVAFLVRLTGRSTDTLVAVGIGRAVGR